MDSIKCKTCDVGTLARRKKYRMSGIVVAIGYILLVPSILGIVISVGGVLLVGAGSSSALDARRGDAEARLRTASVPAPVVTKVTHMRDLAVSDTAVLSGGQRAAVRDAQLMMAASAVGAGAGAAFAGGLFVMFGVASLVGGLLGWLLVMKKKVLQCDNCGAVVAAS